MCFELDSSPPIPGIRGAAIANRDLVLEARDGNRFAAFTAEPDEPSRVGVVVLPDVRGLYRFYEELALRVAERGMAAVAFDYFGRTAGTAKRDDDFEIHAARRPDDRGGSAGGRRGLHRGPARPRLQFDLHRRVLLRRPQLVAVGGRRASTGRRDWVLRASGRRA